MTSASAGSPKGQDPERGLIAEGDNIAVGRQADAPNPCFTTPNPILEGVELREAYARVIDPETFAELDHNRQMRAKMFLGDPTIEPDEELVHNRNAALAKADAILSLKATPLIGLSQGEGLSREKLARLALRHMFGFAYAGESLCDEADRLFAAVNPRITKAVGFADEIIALSGLSLPGRDADVREAIRKAKALADKTYGIAWHNLEEISRFELFLSALSTVQDGSVREALAWARNALESIERASETVCAATSSATYEMRLKDCGVNALIDLDQARELCRQAAARANSVLSALPQSGDKI